MLKLLSRYSGKSNKEITEPEHKSNGFDEIPVMPMSFLYRIFCWCSGARIYLLRKCPTDYNVFLGIGIVIFLTGVLAFISGSYAFYTVFNSEKLSLAFGLFWGMLIFFLDWYLVSSLKKQGKVWKELLMSLPRFMFAVFLGIVISKPVELKLFEPEIRSKIESLNLDATLGNKSKIQEEFKEIKDLKFANEEIAVQLKQKEMHRNKLFELVINEAEGKSGTGMAGKGSVYREKKEAFDQASKEFDELKASLQPVVENNINRIKQLVEKQDAAMERTSDMVHQSSGFLARLDALEKLSATNKTIRWTNWFITLLFICIESAPIFVKLISSRSAYDELLEAESMKKRIAAQKLVADLTINKDARYAIDVEYAELQREASVGLKNNLVYEVVEAQNHLNKMMVEEWKQKEEKKLKNNLEEYLPVIEEIVEGPGAKQKSENTTKTEQNGASK